MKWMIGIVPALLLAAWGRSESSGSRHQVTEPEEWTLPREGASGLELRTQGGNIRVVGAAVEQLQVRALKKARGDSDADARAFLELMRVERRRDGDRWVVEASWPEPRPRHIEEANVSFEIQVPHGMRLDAESRGGNVEVSGVGETRLHTGGGNIQARDIGGALDVHTGGGNLQVDACTGPIDLETGGGNIEIHQAQHAVKAHTGGGNIQVEGRAGPVDAHTGGGNIGIRQAESPVKAITGAGNVQVEIARASGAAQVELGTGAGNVDLRLPQDISARVEANSNLGHVQMEPAAGAQYNRGHGHLQAVLGDGQGSVRLRTGVGGIRIRLTATP
jgi:putative adhesin